MKYLLAYGIGAIKSESTHDRSLPKYTKGNIIDNAIHSLFGTQNWMDIADSDYKAISLSLRLSSFLIREVSLLGWWIHAMYGTKTFNVVKLGHCLRGYVEE